MANVEKHKRNLIHLLLEGDEGTGLTQSRSVHLVGAQGKAAKPVPRRLRLPLQEAPAPKPDLALAREPAPPARVEEKHSQASAPEHLRKQQRIPRLRAPYPAKSGKPAPGSKP